MLEKNAGQPETPKSDIFGQPTERPAENPVVEKKEEAKDLGELEKNPVIAGLKKQVDDYGNNLKEQGNIIKTQADEIARLKKGEPVKPSEVKVELPYPSIKRSKDLTAEEREEMTQNEIDAVDKLADAQEKANSMAKETAEKEQKRLNDEAGIVESAKTEAKKVIAAEVARLSGGDAEKTREINEAIALTNFEGLKTPEEIKARVAVAMKHLPEFVPPKDQTTVAPGNSVKSGGADPEDPENMRRVVEEARLGNSGSYSL